MRRNIYIVVALLGATCLYAGSAYMYGGPAFAFQETEIPSTGLEEGAGVRALPDQGGALDLSGTDKSDGAVSGKSRSLYIPGLGTFDNFPKIDFGLELLYEEDDTVLPNDQNDGMGIKGRLKHNF